MTGYVCKYAPYEIIEAFGENTEFINFGSKDIYEEPSCLHSNLCSFAKRVFSECTSDTFLSLNCCDSLRRVADAFENQNKKVFRVSLPHAVNEDSAEFFAREIFKLIDEAEKYFGKKFDEQRFAELINKKTKEDEGPHIAVIGARTPLFLIDEIQKISPYKIKNHTCSEQHRNFSVLPGKTKEEIIKAYAKDLIYQAPCMRMSDASLRNMLINENTKGIVYHTVKFCDFYSDEVNKNKNNIPYIQIETEFDSAVSGQISTRLEAFFENNFGKENTMDINKNGSYYVGIDSGSTSTAAVLTDKDGNILESCILPTGAKSSDSASAAFEAVTKDIDKKDIIATVSTGYGRKNTDIRTKDITEISCHAKGVFAMFKKPCTVIDIGGQDSKIIITDDKGGVRDFCMNDKCAAGTGRFFELMADTLKMPLSELSGRGKEAKEEITISSMCAVFAESEMVSLIADNKDTDDIICAVNNAVAARIYQMAMRIGAKAPFVLTGGVAQNKGLACALERKFGDKVYALSQPQLSGALGAALLVKESL